MLFIDQKHPKTQKVYTENWYVGEPEPIFAGRSVTFVADGDELMIIVDAIRKASSAVR